MDLTVQRHPRAEKNRVGNEGESGGFSPNRLLVGKTLLFLFFFFRNGGGRRAVQWGHKGLNMSTETVRVECVSVCEKPSKKGDVSNLDFGACGNWLTICGLFTLVGGHPWNSSGALVNGEG